MIRIIFWILYVHIKILWTHRYSCLNVQISAGKCLAVTNSSSNTASDYAPHAPPLQSFLFRWGETILDADSDLGRSAIEFSSGPIQATFLETFTHTDFTEVYLGRLILKDSINKRRVSRVVFTNNGPINVYLFRRRNRSGISSTGRWATVLPPLKSRRQQ
jgi:hypothetical protein